LNDWNIYNMWNTWNFCNLWNGFYLILDHKPERRMCAFFLARSLRLYHTYAESVGRDDNVVNKISN
jgi:hypothetical protein